jgi:hypothetical protein
VLSYLRARTTSKSSAVKFSPKRIAGIKLETAEAVPVELTPLGGVLQIGGVDPTATVLIDDQKPSNLSIKKDERLIELSDVPPGDIGLRVQQGQNEWTREVEVEDGRTKYVATDFKVALVGLVVKTEPEAEI